MCRAEGHGHVVIGAHAHGKFRQPVPLRDLSQQRKMERGFFLHRRNAHEPRDRQPELVPAQRNKRIRLFGKKTRFLRFLTRIDLNEKLRQLCAFFTFLHEGAGKFLPVESFNHIEKRNGVLHFVGLQRTDEMKLKAGVIFPQLRPFAVCFLHPVFTEEALARCDDRTNFFRVKRLGNGNKRHVLHLPVRAAGRFGNADFHLGKTGSNIGGHGKSFAEHLEQGQPIAKTQPTAKNNGAHCQESRLMTGTGEKLRRTARRLGRKEPDLPPIIVMSDARRAPDAAAMIRALPPEAAFIFRHYELAPHDREKRARQACSAARYRNIPFLVAGDAKLAARIGADGLHLPEWQIMRLESRLALNLPFGFITAAAHSPAALRRAASAGVDAALLSPVFATKSHVGARPLGLAKAAEWARAATLPVYALGGINEETAARLSGTDFCGIAGIGFASAAEAHL